MSSLRFLTNNTNDEYKTNKTSKKLYKKNDTSSILFEQNQRSCDIGRADWSTAFHP